MNSRVSGPILPAEHYMTNHEKSFISIRYWLLGSRMHLALLALEFASKFHVGTRKDGVTPEFGHQLAIAHYVRTFIAHLDHPEETLASVFLHDVCEDYDVGYDEIHAKFGQNVCDSVRVLTKKHRRTQTPADVYYHQISENKIASIVKGADRVNNIQTMVDVFNIDKQNSYITETNNHVLPMLKTARRLFSTQESAYENIKIMLQNQIFLIEAIHRAKTEVMFVSGK